MQNTLLTKNTAFMKSWDILNNYFSEDDSNYMWKSTKKQLLSDYETLLYACFVLKEKIIKKILKETDSSRTILEEVYEIVRQNMSRILNIYNVNSTSALKNYTSVIDTDVAKKYFREIYPHVHFNKNEELMKNQIRDDASEYKQSSKER